MEFSAVLLTLCALFGWLNHKYLPMPHTIGLLVMSVLASLVLVVIDASFPDQHLFAPLTDALLRVDFSSVVMDGMLAFLLFAGALHVDVSSLKDRALPVIVLATLGTVLSTAVVGFAFWFGAKMLGYPVSLAWSLVFGALISPTDPVAVLSTLKNVAVPKSLESEMQGEALFNDGVGIVIFTIMVRIAMQGDTPDTSALQITELLLLEAGGGILLGIGNRLSCLQGDVFDRRLRRRGSHLACACHRHLCACIAAAYEWPSVRGRCWAFDRRSCATRCVER